MFLLGLFHLPGMTGPKFSRPYFILIFFSLICGWLNEILGERECMSNSLQTRESPWLSTCLLCGMSKTKMLLCTLESWVSEPWAVPDPQLSVLTTSAILLVVFYSRSRKGSHGNGALWLCKQQGKPVVLPGGESQGTSCCPAACSVPTPSELLGSDLM